MRSVADLPALSLLQLALPLLLLAVAGEAAAQARSSFSIVVFGDTQRVARFPDHPGAIVVNTSMSRLEATVDTVAADASVGLVLQVGDFVDGGNTSYAASPWED